MTKNEVEGFVSVVNSIIERFCEKHPDEFEFDSACIWYDASGEVKCANGDDLAETLMWVNGEVIPDLLEE